MASHTQPVPHTQRPMGLLVVSEPSFPGNCPELLVSQEDMCELLRKELCIE